MFIQCGITNEHKVLLVDGVILGQQDAQGMVLGHEGFRPLLRRRLNFLVRVTGKEVHQRIKEQRRPHRLGQVSGEIGRALSFLSPTQRRIQYQRQRFGVVVPLARRRPTQPHLFRASAYPGWPGQRDRPARTQASACSGEAVSRASMPQLRACRTRMRRLVVLSSTTSSFLPASSGWSGDRCGRAFRAGASGAFDREVEGRPLAGAGAFCPHIAAHHLAQAAADDQTQAGAAKAAGRGSVHLAESLEEAVHALGRDADAGIADGEVDGVLVSVAASRR